MDRNVMMERLQWLATAQPGAPPPEWLKDNLWAIAISEIAAAALDAIPQFRPIDEAPIPDPEHVPEYWTYPCVTQDAKGNVAAGFARYVNYNNNPNRKNRRILRWYEGVPDGRCSTIANPVYFMPLPQPRKD